MSFGPRSGALNGYGQPLGAADDECAAPFRLFVQQAQPREAQEQRADGDLCLRACERRSEAEVDAVAEREVVRGIAADVELFGVLVVRGVPVAGGEKGKDHLALVESVPGDLNVLLGHAAGAVYRTGGAGWL